jgi:hypothetical protein
MSGLCVLPVIARGIWNEAHVRLSDGVANPSLGGDREGYVVRLSTGFRYRAFAEGLLKALLRRD